MKENEIHRCKYVSLLVEAEYIIWLAENSADCFSSPDLLNAIKNYKAKRLAVVQKVHDTRLSA